MNKKVRQLYVELVKETHDLNCQVTYEGQTKHQHHRWNIRHRKSGATRKYFTASTSTSNTGRLNAIKDVRRIARNLADASRLSSPARI